MSQQIQINKENKTVAWLHTWGTFILVLLTLFIQIGLIFPAYQTLDKNEKYQKYRSKLEAYQGVINACAEIENSDIGSTEYFFGVKLFNKEYHGMVYFIKADSVHSQLVDIHNKLNYINRKILESDSRKEHTNIAQMKRHMKTALVVNFRSLRKACSKSLDKILVIE